MTPTQFIAWLAQMRAEHIATSDASCARLLGITPRTLLSLKSNGTDIRTAYACAAILAGLKPYTDEGE